MGTAYGSPDAGVDPARVPDPTATRDAIVAQARRSAFFPLMRALERLAPAVTRVGGDGPVAEEAIRFRHDPSLQFHTADVTSAQVVSDTDERGARRETIELVTTFLGLTGASSPLPSYLAEEVALEDTDRPVLRDFYDIFHHRLISLLYRSVARYDQPAESTSDHTDAWSRRVLALAGIDSYDRALPPERARLMLRLAPLLARRRRGVAVLENALVVALGDAVPEGGVRIRQFLGAWVPVDDSEKMRLGRSNSTLGVSSMLGARTYDRSGRFRVELGPVTADVYRRLQHGGDLLDRIRLVVAATLTAPLEYDLDVTVSADPRTAFRLGGSPGAPLGRSSWLSSSTAASGMRGRIDPNITNREAAAPASP